MSGGPMKRSVANAGTRLILRAVAAGYLLYLAWGLFRELLSGSSTLPLWLGWAAPIAFSAAGICFGFYAWQRYRIDRAAETAEREESSGESE